MKRHPLEASPVTPEFAKLYELLDGIRHTPSADRILNAVGAVEMRYIAAVKAERDRCANRVLRLATCTCSPYRGTDTRMHGGGCMAETMEGLAAAIRSAE